MSQFLPKLSNEEPHKDKLSKIRAQIAKYNFFLQEVEQFLSLKSAGWEHKEVLKAFYENKLVELKQQELVLSVDQNDSLLEIQNLNPIDTLKNLLASLETQLSPQIISFLDLLAEAELDLDIKFIEDDFHCVDSKKNCLYRDFACVKLFR